MDKLKRIKALNQRLAEMERKGLGHTTAYMNMIAAINPDWETASRNGHVRISRSKSVLKDLTSNDLDFLELKIIGLGGLSRHYGLKGKALYKRLDDVTILTEFMERNDAMARMYIAAKRGTTKQEIAAAEFVDMARNGGGLSRYSYDEIFAKIKATGIQLVLDDEKPDIKGVNH